MLVVKFDKIRSKLHFLVVWPIPAHRPGVLPDVFSILKQKRVSSKFIEFWQVRSSLFCSCICCMKFATNSLICMLCSSTDSWLFRHPLEEVDRSRPLGTPSRGVSDEITRDAGRTRPRAGGKQLGGDHGWSLWLAIQPAFFVSTTFSVCIYNWYCATVVTEIRFDQSDQSLMCVFFPWSPELKHWIIELSNDVSALLC